MSTKKDDLQTQDSHASGEGQNGAVEEKGYPKTGSGPLLDSHASGEGAK